MYARSDGHRSDGRQDVFIPENYSGTAFGEVAEQSSNDLESDTDEKVDETTPVSAEPKRRGSLFDGISGEDLLLLGVILLLSQEEEGNDVLPILLLLLFFRKQ